MSRAVPAHLAAIEDLRLEQAGAAARTARRNQPTGLLFAAGALLLIALIYVIIAASSRQSSIAALKKSRDQAGDAVQLAAELKALRAAASTSRTNVGTASMLYTRIENAGVAAGLTNRVPLPATRSESQVPGATARQFKYDYNVTDPSLPALLSWVQRSVDSVPGLEVFALSLQPEANNWRLRVSFSRWEKTEGS